VRSSKRDAGKDPEGALEPVLVMRTLRDMNLSKFVAEDVPLFLALIKDLFPDLKAPAMKHPLVEPAVKKAVDANNLQSLPSWMLKIIQVYEMCLVRHSLMPVGHGQVEDRAGAPAGLPVDRCAARRSRRGHDRPAPKVREDEPEGDPLGKDVRHDGNVAAGEWHDGIFSHCRAASGHATAR
jgi:dynein heavy chain, axonemal